MSNNMIKKPELLAPAGSPEALDAAIAGGADAVYFGASAFNARMNAQNFDRDKITRAIEKCRNYGVRSNITFNTLVYGRELEAALDEVRFLNEVGADALIVADIGLASLIHKNFPDLPLHASTQMSAHSLDAVKLLADAGFERAVVARELDREMIELISKSSPIETEIFIHGALCVSYSGQCLFSYAVGGRSGNRGECAQPCRLPYSGSYPLSLKDNCLAEHMVELLESGAASYKIEGRMKSPAYVYGVTSIYRRLIDERRNATTDEMKKLDALFSRSGFTDGYYTKKIDSSMNGVRTDADKEKSKVSEELILPDNRRKIKMTAELYENAPARLTVTLKSDSNISIKVDGVICERAMNAPLSTEAVKKNLLKLGSTDFSCDEGDIEVKMSENMIIPVSKINALRREGIAELEKMLKPERRVCESEQRTEFDACLAEIQAFVGEKKPTARFLSADQITDEAKKFFNIIYLPLDKFDPERANGVIIPPVIFDSELPNVRKMLESAKNNGAVHALVGNLGHLKTARDAGLICHADLRLNVANPFSVRELLKLGFADIIPSAELTLVKCDELGEAVAPNTVIYGRLPLMTLEKCAVKATVSCEKCAAGKAELIDRMGEKFPVYRDLDHRNVVYNSRVTYMADKRDVLEKHGVFGGHFIFTDETSAQVARVILAYKNALPTDKPVRRVAVK